MSLVVRAFPCGPLQANCYVLHDASGDGVIVDCGGRLDAIYAYIAQHDVNVRMVVVTHAHFDHIFGVGYLRERYPSAKVYCHQADRQQWQLNTQFAAQFGVPAPKNMLPAADVYFDDGFTFKVGEAEFRTLHTPGHTPGSCCFVCAAQKLVLTGDTLFSCGVGRTDFVGGDPRAMRKSIALLEKEIPGDFVVYPGHDAQEVAARALESARMMV